MVINRHGYIVVYIALTLFHYIKEIRGAPPDITFVINNANASHIIPTCIAEGAVLKSAITWIYPIVDSNEKLPTIVSNFVPERNIEYNCNFVKTKPCSNIWQIDGWQFSSFDSHAFKPISDSRWENFPTYVTSNTTKEFSTRIDIPTTFQIGFSIRGSKNAEIFVCEGWNPRTYPCYYINIGGTDNKQSFLRKYKNGIPDKFSKNDTKLAKFKLDMGILSEDEWKSFTLSLHDNGTLILNENFNNTTMLNYTDKNQLKPINYIIRSKNYSTLWKIHKNEYIYTTKKNVTKFGPVLNLYGTQLCVSLHVSLCRFCNIKFFILVNGAKKILAEITENNEYDVSTWKEIKLLENNVFEDALQLFLETDYSKSNESENGFWAVDDVRICTENEIKVTRLQVDMTFKEFENSHINCQALKFPMWRPIHHISPDTSVGEVTCNSSTSTSIKLFWKPIIDDKTFQEYSGIKYEGFDICKYDQTVNGPQLINKQRQKSQGYVIGKSNEITIENLVPYTLYNISFWNILDNDKKSFEMNTLPTVIPTKEELPRHVIMKVTDTTNEMIWEKPKCNETYGPVVYQIYIKNQNGTDTRYYVDSVTRYNLTDLQPFTNYTVEIRTARKIDNLNGTQLHIKTIHNFTTQSGIAPGVDQLELYSTGKQSASLRFELPQHCRGITTLMQIRWCHPLFLSGCLSEIHNLTKCKLWDNKYCIEVNNLVMGNEYQFSVSIKNKNSFAFGTEGTVKGKAIERVPGKPTNITYTMIECNKVDDYCHLNISWNHPSGQQATITMFDVVLTETSYNFVVDTLKSIHEIVKIIQKEYQKRYYCIVKYIPYNTPYKISVRAVNDVYKGDFEFIIMKTETIDRYVDQTPEFIDCTNETITFKLPKLDWRLNSSTLIVIVQDYDKTKDHITDDIVKLEMFNNKYKLCNDFGNTWVAKTLTLSSTESQLIVIGDESINYIQQLQKDIPNKVLKPNTEYCFTFALFNQHKNSETLAVYHAKNLFTQRNSIAEKQNDKSSESPNAAVYVVPLLFIILMIGCIIWFGRRYVLRRRRGILDGDHIYESMPFDDYIPNAVSNQNYDRLVHK